MTSQRPGIAHLGQRWHEPTYFHTPVDLALTDTLPAGVTVDRFAGTPWIGVACFEVRDMRPFGLPTPPSWRLINWVNVRTYVTGPEGPGVWFLAMHIPSRLVATVVRYGSHQPAHRSEIVYEATPTYDQWTVRPDSDAEPFIARVEGTRSSTPERSEFSAFFAGRPIEYVNKRGSVAVVDTWHDEPTTTETTDFSIDGLHLLHASLANAGTHLLCHTSPSIDVRMSFPRKPRSA